jgi:hypothetical protein
MSFFGLVGDYFKVIRDIIATTINGVVQVLSLFRGGSATIANTEAISKFYTALGSPTNVKLMNAALDESAKKVENLVASFNKVSIPNVSALTNLVANSAPVGAETALKLVVRNLMPRFWKWFEKR